MSKRKATDSGTRDAANDDDDDGDASGARPSSGIIEVANALTEDQFVDAYFGPFAAWTNYKHVAWVKGLPCNAVLCYAASLDEELLQNCFDLIERTSRHDYAPSSIGWHAKRKLREMKEKEMRYILLYGNKAQDFAGFLSFMLTYDSVPAVPVLYVYEIHLEKAYRSKGVGKGLMRVAEDIARKVGVEKIMLTCFKSNVKARTFYEALEYVVDVSSPEDRETRNKVVKTDYVIMSKNISRQSNGTSSMAVNDNSASVAAGEMQDEVGHRSTSKAAMRIATLSGSYKMDHKLKMWIQANCNPQLQQLESRVSSVVHKEAERLLPKARAGIANTPRDLDDLRVLSALYVGLQERFDGARKLQYAIWDVLEPMHRNLQDLSMQPNGEVVHQVEIPIDSSNAQSCDQSAPLPILADFIDSMPSTMRAQTLKHVKASGADLADRERALHARELEFHKRENALDAREMQLDQREDDLFARETALQEHNARHDRARNNIRARAQALKQREGRLNVREQRWRDETGKMKEKQIPTETRTKSTTGDHDQDGSEELRPWRPGSEPDSEYDRELREEEERWGEAFARSVRNQYMQAEEVDESEVVPVDDDHDASQPGAAAARSKHKNQPSIEANVAADGARKSTGHDFELPRPEALRGVEVVGDKVDTWLRRSGSVRDSFGSGRAL